ncbi:CHAT domain-containing protein [Cellulomonas fimi]|uniref:CHAT domain-containing protein n=1 Tax=Cellulomonas fimi TaxID=1708 RepID=UPI00235A3477|nr:CHAT domain-containing protein [Cellulomonas fimi]
MNAGAFGGRVAGPDHLAARGPVMDEYADLEIQLYRKDDVTYGIWPALTLPRSDADARLDGDSAGFVAHIDPDALRDLDPTEYGRALGKGLFGGGFGAAFRQAVQTASSNGVRLRVRLVVDPAPEAAALHGVLWETLRDPDDDRTLLTDENVLFSRFLGSRDWRPVRPRSRGDLRALVVVASPTDVGEYAPQGRGGLAPLDVEAELERARTALGDMAVTVLPGEATPTAANLVAQLRRGYDVVYLVCHGYLQHHEPVLLLVDDDGAGAPMLGSDLVQQLGELSRTPGLVFLASCRSAGEGEDARSDDAGVLAALGPRLAAAGVPAVVAMQGDVTMATAGTFASAFFRSLDSDGLVDRACAVGRAAVRDRDDWWVPTLFMRLRSGRMWYDSGGSQGLFEKWPSVVRDIEDEKCTPIVGPGISDLLLGSRQEVARAWANRYRFPMAPHNRESLPQVAQYLAINQSRSFPRSELEQHVRRTVIERFGDEIPEPLRTGRPPIEDVLAAGWHALRDRGAIEPYSVLADLTAPVYITTQPTRLLANALEAAGKQPEIELCRWNDDIEWPESVYEREPGYRPTVQRPLVYHLLGLLEVPESLVLTEDDYFDYLIGVTQNRELVPRHVRGALTRTALMFVGFRLDEWDFRVLYRSVMNYEGKSANDHTHVAVQIDPEEGSTSDPVRARAYLEGYFRDGARVSLYWGSTERFVKELHDQWGSR